MSSKARIIMAAVRGAEARLDLLTNDRIHAMAGSHGSLNIAILKLIDLVVEEVLKGTDITLSFKNARHTDLDRLIDRMIECADTFLVDRANAALVSSVILYFAGTDPRTGVPAGNRKLGAMCRIAAGVPRGGVVNLPSQKLGNKVTGFAAVSALFEKLRDGGLTSINGKNIPFGAIGTLYMHSVLGEDIVLPEVIRNGTEVAVNAMSKAMQGIGMMMCPNMGDKLTAALFGAAAVLELIHPDANAFYEDGYIPSSHMVGRIAAKTAGLPDVIHMRLTQKAFVTGDLIGDLAILFKDAGAATVVGVMNVVDSFSMFEEWLTWTGGPTITPISSLGGEAWIAMNCLLEEKSNKEEAVELLSSVRKDWFDPEISRMGLNIVASKALEFGVGPVSEVLKDVTEGTRTWALYDRAERAYDMLEKGSSIQDVVRHFEDKRKVQLEESSSSYCSQRFNRQIRIKLLRVEPLGRIAKKGEGIGKYWALDPDVDVSVTIDGREIVLEQLCQVWIPKVARMEAEEYRVAVESAAIFIQDLSYSGVLLFNATVPTCVAAAMGLGGAKELAKRASDAAYLTAGIPGSQLKCTSAATFAMQLLKESTHGASNEQSTPGELRHGDARPQKVGAAE